MNGQGPRFSGNGFPARYCVRMQTITPSIPTLIPVPTTYPKTLGGTFITALWYLLGDIHCKQTWGNGHTNSMAELTRKEVIMCLNGKGNLSGVDLTNLDLSGLDFQGANLRGANFAGANLSRARMAGADLRDATFWWADLYEADLEDTKLHNADFTNACLAKANLKNANMIGAFIKGTDFEDATLDAECRLPGVTKASQENKAPAKLTIESTEQSQTTEKHTEAAQFTELFTIATK